MTGYCPPPTPTLGRGDEIMGGRGAWGMNGGGGRGDERSGLEVKYEAGSHVRS